MRRPIFIKMFAGYLVVLIAMASLILVFTYGIVRTHYEQTTADNLKSIGMPLRQIFTPLIMEGRAKELNSLAIEYDRKLQTRVTIIDPGGKVLADSEKNPASLENHRDRPEVAEALSGRVGQSIRYSTTFWQDLLYIAIPVETGGKVMGVIRLSTPLTHIDDLLSALRTRMLQLTALVFLVSLAIAALASHLLSTPIRALSRAARQVASGDLSVRVPSPPKADDEIQDLTDGFNEMTRRLEHTFSELSSRNEQLEGIISSMNEGLLVLDEEGKVRLFNESARKIMLADTVMGRYYWELLRSSRLNSLIEQAGSQPVSGEIDLAEKAYLCSITPLASGKSRVVILHDISDMKHIQRIKKDLVVNVSHELRTPLTAIKGFTETLLDEADKKSQEYLGIIRRHTDRLIAMVNDLLTLSELEEKPQLALEELNVQDIIINVLAIYDPRVRAKGLSLEARISPVTIKGDAFKLEQLLTNLMDNALKYTEKGGITVESELKGSNALITVTDTGIGIPREDLSRIFERFYVVDKSRSRSMGGTGLGLSIAKHIASLHKGSIEVTSTPYSGSSFKVILPVIQ